MGNESLWGAVALSILRGEDAQHLILASAFIIASRS